MKVLLVLLLMTICYSDYVPYPMTATAYAPMCPEAIAGWDYCCDPTVTASGRRSQVGTSIAASRMLPFGTRVYIHGVGERVVHDRGSAIGIGKIDIMMDTKKEALRWGRQEVLIHFLPEGSGE